MTAGGVLECIGKGYILLFGPRVSKLVPRPKWIPLAPEIQVPREVSQEMIRRYTLADINELGRPEPHLRKKNEGYRMGWREMELPDPGKSTYYLIMQ